MAIKKQGRNWHIDVTVGNVRVQKSARTTDRAQAQELHDKIRAQLWREVKLGEKPRRTWFDAVKLYLSEKRHLRQLDRVIVPQIEWLSEHIHDETPLDEIGADTIAQLRVIRINQQTPSGRAPKQATVNYPLSILQAILNLARKNGMVASVPYIEMPNPQNSRVRWITQEEAGNLISTAARHYRGGFSALVEFSLETGLRQDNAVSLPWSWVDLTHRTITIPAEEFKNKKPHTIPLSDRATDLLIEQRGRHEKFVFINEFGRRYTHANDQLKEVCAKAGISDFHWHDLRHTWATWHVRAGTPLEVLQRLGGWSDYRMVLRYANIATDHLAAYANALKRDAVVKGDNNVTPIRQAA